MVSDSYDVPILGGGNAGFGVATHKSGLKVALVEERDHYRLDPWHGRLRVVELEYGWSMHLNESWSILTYSRLFEFPALCSTAETAAQLAELCLLHPESETGFFWYPLFY
jgi:hypothetical protein